MVLVSPLLKKELKKQQQQQKKSYVLGLGYRFNFPVSTSCCCFLEF
jgi:hypothetical protein